MMLGEPPHRTNPTVHVPPWPTLNNPTAEIFSPLTSNDDYSQFYMQEALSAFQHYVNENNDSDSDSEIFPTHESVDSYSNDHFRMFEFKIRRCARGRSHDWTECPFSHPGEKARRRDPRKYNYSGTSCPDFRKGSCKKGDSCEFAHGVFECWLHPSRYRTQPCKDGTSCRRPVCFFAHTTEQLRAPTQQSPRSVPSVDSYDGSPLRLAFESSCVKTLQFMSSPGSVSPPVESPPMSPMTRSLGRSVGSSSVNEMVASLRNLQLGTMKSLPSSWNVQMGSPRFGSPRGPVIRPGFCSLPSTPTQVPSRGRVNHFDLWDQSCEEEPVMERVESGRDIRVKMFEKLSKENSFNGSGMGSGSGLGEVVEDPDVGWVSELVSPFLGD
ncbi:putative transcription factor C3H family [Medicago truncatula]|uniref:Putative transcription factor C3H family n=1 Tax=Medicago truncatula TaxID=3880 RepID=A0A072TV59_MEDTR|nr:zinc finger CCCH domain-containing protein 49 [Medicago truncatula]KEH21327.1 zinc finger CCCH domain protein [Medicago truncatula]RHN43590.1 putative transcription factor C3H family [Medicago truncatula]